MSNTAKVIGNGPIRVLALHGWFGDANGWGYLPDLIDQEKYTWAFVNYRGYGDRMDVPGEFTNDEIADDALAIADELGWDSFAVVGHSMGGKAAQKVWLKSPNRVTTIVGVSPIGAAALEWDDDGLALFQGAAHDTEKRYTILDFTTGNRNTATWLNKMTEYSLAHSTPEAYGAYFTAWGLDDFAEELPAEGHPTVHVIVGENDPASGPEGVKGTWLTNFPDATLQVIANAGHYPMYEAPVNFVTALEKALG
ncbi:alpha/beta fold hydrolase [Enemella sp. A6]|uniref:alpha/beta fold hydrolase n=1 Tax=Enemella sp. A6 TaxID=3440152 RepID=UPI003EC124AD